MALSSTRLTRDRSDLWRGAAAGLVVAAAVVGIAIVAGGPGARVLNGVGGLIWLASGALLAWSLPDPARRATGWLAAITAGLILGVVVRPGSLAPAIVGFAIGGAFVVLVAGDRTGGWALLAPAVYLPVHLLFGIVKAVSGQTGVRIEPPPTAAIVPLVMVVAAGAGGALAAYFARRGTIGGRSKWLFRT